MTTEEIIRRARENAKQRLELIEEVKKMLIDKALCAKIKEVDSSFIYKIFNYSGDITTHRIEKVLSKIK